MATCSVCGNEYDKPLEIRYRGETHLFDCFACAIHALAPTCAHCHAPVISQGVEAGGSIYCGAHCARECGVQDVRDRIEPAVWAPPHG